MGASLASISITVASSALASSSSLASSTPSASSSSLALSSPLASSACLDIVPLCSALVAVPGWPAGESWQACLQAMPHDQLVHVTASYNSYKQAQDEWLEARPKVADAAVRVKRFKNAAVTVDWRYSTGLAFLRWKEQEGQKSKAP